MRRHRRSVPVSKVPGSGGGRGRRFRPGVESVEGRLLMAVFTVSNLNDAGAGSLRQALIGADADTTPSVVDFSVAGTITLTSGALPDITHSVYIDGRTAPGFAGQAPVVEVDNNGFGGLQFGIGSDGSALRSLAIVRSGSDGVTLIGGKILIAGDYIGVGLDGTTALPNLGNGLVISETSAGNAIGAPSTVASGSVLSVASNVISGNFGNGLVVDGGSGNAIMANYIGTTAGGLGRLGNGGNGIVLTGGASGNLIGGTIPFVNQADATPQGNLVSSNAGAGVYLAGGQREHPGRQLHRHRPDRRCPAGQRARRRRRRPGRRQQHVDRHGLRPDAVHLREHRRRQRRQRHPRRRLGEHDHPGQLLRPRLRQQDARGQCPRRRPDRGDVGRHPVRRGDPAGNVSAANGGTASRSATRRAGRSSSTPSPASPRSRTIRTWAMATTACSSPRPAAATSSGRTWSPATIGTASRSAARRPACRSSRRSSA